MDDFEELQRLLDGWAPSIRDGLFFDRRGERIEWAEFAGTKVAPENGRIDVVGQEQVGDFEVSTVWLGWAEGRDQSGRPLIFETMVLSNSDDEARVMGRYATEAEAEKGHQRVVARLRSGEVGGV